MFPDPDQGTMTLAWPLSAAFAQAELSRDPALKARGMAVKDREGAYLLEALEARTGRVLGRVVMETGRGAFQIQRILVAGDTLVIDDSGHRTLVYSLATGEPRAKFFAEYLALARGGGLLCAEKSPGRVGLWDLGTLKEREPFAFSSPVSLARFSPDGRRLLILTTSQTAYLLDTGS